MAYYSNDSNRDGMDDDIDRKPGNENESAGLARREDPRSEQEYSNLISVQNQIQERSKEERYERHRAKTREAMLAAQQDVHFFEGVGKFIIPAENTWAAHADLVLNNEMRLHFNPDKYFFDKIIADQLNIPALTDRKHPDFAKYRGLRTNLEVLRNDIIGQYLDDGGFDKGDEVFIPPIKAIAETIGNALSNDVWWKRPFVNYFPKDVANVEAVGAAEIYKYLLAEQEGPTGFFGKVYNVMVEGLRDLAGLPMRRWGLLKLEDSPFSPEGLSAPAPAIERMVASDTDLPLEHAEHRAMESLALINKTNTQFQPVATLAQDDKAKSVEDGRTILRWLRNLQGVDMDVQDFLSAGTPPEQMAKAEALSSLVKLYTAQVQQAPHMHGLPEVKDGADAAGGAAMMLAEHALSALPESSPAYALLASAIDTQPENHYERSTQSVSRLLDLMENGLSKVSGKQVGDLSPVDKLLQVSGRIHHQAQQLRSVSTLTAPKREESVELGREILRKLRGLSVSNKPMDELVNGSKPEDKVAVAEKLEELIEIYRNILADALVADPGLANDPRIKAANDAVGSASHGIKLMAAKEIPSNAAATQQIAADITQMPEEWKRLNGVTVERLMDSMEGGLAAAVDSMDAQDQAQQKDAEIAQDALEASLLQTEGSKRRKRRSSKKSGISGKQSEKLMRETMMDDLAAGQGRHAEKKEEKKTEAKAAYMGLSDKDMAAIAALGTKLNGANKQAKSLPSGSGSSGSNGSKGGSPKAINDRSKTEQVIEKITSAKKNNNTRGAS